MQYQTCVDTRESRYDLPKAAAELALESRPPVPFLSTCHGLRACRWPVITGMTQSLSAWHQKEPPGALAA